MSFAMNHTYDFCQYIFVKCNFSSQESFFEIEVKCNLVSHSTLSNNMVGNTAQKRS